MTGPTASQPPEQLSYDDGQDLITPFGRRTSIDITAPTVICLRIHAQHTKSVDPLPPGCHSLPVTQL